MGGHPTKPYICTIKRKPSLLPLVCTLIQLSEASALLWNTLPATIYCEMVPKKQESS